MTIRMIMYANSVVMADAAAVIAMPISIIFPVLDNDDSGPNREHQERGDDRGIIDNQSCRAHAITFSITAASLSSSSSEYVLST